MFAQRATCVSSIALRGTCLQLRQAAARSAPLASQHSRGGCFMLFARAVSSASGGEAGHNANAVKANQSPSVDHMSPMMHQYWAIKLDPQYSGYLLLFQLGNFLEAFFEDAEVLSSTLGIALTARGSHRGKPLPMAGVPLHAKEAYLARLVKAGVKVIICEQKAEALTVPLPSPSRSKVSSPLSFPAGPPRSTLMHREVTRVVTRGTIVDESLLTPDTHNYIASVAFSLPVGEVGVTASIVWLDVSTGDLLVNSVPLGELGTELATYPPVELLMSNGTAMACAGGVSAHPQPIESDNSTRAEDTQKELMAAAQHDPVAQRLLVCARAYRRHTSVAARTSAAFTNDASNGTSAARASDSKSSSRGTGRSPPTFAIEVGGPDTEPTSLTFVDEGDYNASSGRALLASVAPSEHSLPGFSECEYACCGALLKYVAWTQLGRLPPMRTPVHVGSPLSHLQPGGGEGGGESSPVPTDGSTVNTATAGAYVDGYASTHGAVPRRLLIDAATRRALELTRPFNGRRRARGSLLHCIDLCQTALGSRMLDSRICSPLASAPAINNRLDSVQWFAHHADLRESTRAALTHVPDLERCLQRLTLGRGQPRDLVTLRDGLRAVQRTGAILLSGDHERLHVPPSSSRAHRNVSATITVEPSLLHALRATATEELSRQGSSCARVLQCSERDFDSVTSVGWQGGDALPLQLLHAAAACAYPLVDATTSSTTSLPGPSLKTSDQFHTDMKLLDELLKELDSALERSSPTASADGTTGLQNEDTAEAASDTASSGAVAAASGDNDSWIRTGYDSSLDEARGMRDHASVAVAALQGQLRLMTGVKSLKIRRTDDYGYTVEVPHAYAAQLEAFSKTSGPSLATSTPVSPPLVLRFHTPGEVHDASVTTLTTPIPPPPGLIKFVLVKSLKASQRYKCKPLSDLESRVAAAAARTSAIEAAIIARLCGAVAACHSSISSMARAVAVIDVSASHAELASRHNLTRPQVSEPEVCSHSSLPEEVPASGGGGRGSALRPELLIEGGRHMVVERALLEGWAANTSDSNCVSSSSGMMILGEDMDDFVDRTLPSAGADTRMFVPNDTALNTTSPRSHRHTLDRDDDTHESGGLASSSLALLCGPNMGGKSTYLRQVAHVVVLAQMGAFVPARRVRLAVVDRVFSRIGASDDVTRDKSTFFMEMEETGSILRNATRHSLVIVDEIGRGTSMVDGLALAWAVLEHLAFTTQCRTLFATHIHELTAIAVAQNLRIPSAGTAVPNPIVCVSDCGAVGSPTSVVPATTSSPVTCLTMATHLDSSGSPVLTHRVTPHPILRLLRAGSTPLDAHSVWKQVVSMSYGVHVAAMAGVPPSVLSRARGILEHLDASQAGGAWASAVCNLPVPAQPPLQRTPSHPHTR